MFGIFDWIRRSARAALVAGVQDGLNDLTGAEGEAPDAPVLRLTFRPEKMEETPAKGRRKAE